MGLRKIFLEPGQERSQLRGARRSKHEPSEVFFSAPARLGGVSEIRNKISSHSGRADGCTRGPEIQETKGTLDYRFRGNDDGEALTYSMRFLDGPPAGRSKRFQRRGAR